MPTLSTRVVRRLLEHLPADGEDLTREVQDLRITLVGSLGRRPASSARRKTRAKRETKREATRRIRAAVANRAGLECECGCGRWFRGVGGEAQLDHFEGKARNESAESCWLIRADCHEWKTRNSPSASHWLKLFVRHCDRHGYAEQARRTRDRLAFVEARELLTKP